MYSVGSQAIILSFLQYCTSGKLGMAECGPVWQLGVIALFILAGILALLVLRVRARPQAGEA